MKKEKIYQGLIVLLFIGLLSGKYSLGRVYHVNYDIRFINEVRYWILIPYFYIIFMIRLAPLNINKRNIYPMKKWNFVVSLLFMYLLLSSFWSPNFKNSISQCADLLIILFVILTLPVLFYLNPQKKTEFFLRCLAITSILYVVGGLSGASIEAGRISAFGGGPNIFVRVTGMGIIAFLYLWMKEKRTMWIYFIPGLLGAAVMSGSRGGIIALLVALGVLSLWMIKNLRLKRIVTSLIVVILISLLLLSISTLKNKMYSFVFKRFYQLTLVDRYTSSRDILFTEGLDMFLSSPLFGVGFKGFEFLTETTQKYTHNLLLDLAVEGGIVALLLFFFILISVFRRWFRPRNLENNIALIQSLFIFVASLFSGGIYDTRFMWVFLSLYMMPANNADFSFNNAYSYKAQNPEQIRKQ